MKHWIACTAVMLLSATTVMAQKPLESRTEAQAETTRRESSTSEVAQTPEMWFYEQQIERRDNPRIAVREKAELDARRRDDRIASLKWYGYSNQRPVANPDVMHGAYSPQWIGNTYNPSAWSTANRRDLRPRYEGLDVRQY